MTWPGLDFQLILESSSLSSMPVSGLSLSWKASAACWTIVCSTRLMGSDALTNLMVDFPGPSAASPASIGSSSAACPGVGIVQGPGLGASLAVCLLERPHTGGDAHVSALVG